MKKAVTNVSIHVIKLKSDFTCQKHGCQGSLVGRLSLIERYSHQGRGMMQHIIMVSTVCQDKY